jgi:hypothetical protein
MSKAFKFEENVGRLARVSSWDEQGEMEILTGIILSASPDPDHENFLGIEFKAFIKYEIMLPCGTVDFFYGDQVEIQKG